MIFNKKIYIPILLVAAVLLGGIGFITNVIWGKNVPDQLETPYFYVPSNTSFEDLYHKLKNEGFILNINSFKDVSKLMKYGEGRIKSGRYKITPGSSNRTLIQLLRSGKQEPINLTFNNIRTIEELAGKIATQIEPDSLQLINYFTNEDNLKSWNVDRNNLISKFLPDTYEVYWNLSPQNLMDKMIKASENFWSKTENQNALSKLKMTKEQVATLASIVQKETLKSDEKPTVAGVYMNRLKRGMPLQADPTVVFALKRFDLKRIRNKHLKVKSPYNTYIHEGLPPGPICMPNANSLESVLKYEKHKYLYFCAKPDYSGYHEFAKNLVQHNRNANNYHRWLNKQKIK